jgi:hypothetical protein
MRAYYRVSADSAGNSMRTMRYRLPPPVRPFDLTPIHLVDAAKRIFTLLWVKKPPTALNETQLCAVKLCPAELVKTLEDS